jgi:hypothetical protein
VDVLKRLKNPEDRFVERKPEGVSSEDIRKTLVAFANSVEDGEAGLLFLGVSDDGKVTGVSDTDKLQKRIGDLAENHCYPPIKVNSQVIVEDEKHIVGVIVPSSRNKPHFSGQAYVRVGSESRRASEEMFTALITSRTDQGRLLLKYREDGIEVVVQRIAHWNPQNETFRTICRIVEVNPYYAEFQQVPAGERFSLEINCLSVRWEASLGQPLVRELRR